MEKHRLLILICETYKHELERVLDSNEFPDVVFKEYSSICSFSGNVPSTIEEIFHKFDESFSHYAILGSYCTLELKRKVQPSSNYSVYYFNKCQELFATPEFLDGCAQSGAYFVTPGWVVNWRDKIQDWGFEKKHAREFFNDFCKKLVLLDTGVLPSSKESIIEFAEFLGLPYEVIRTGISHFHLIIKNMVLDWRLKTIKESYEAKLEKANQDISIYAMIMDILKDMVQAMEENEVIQKIVYMFSFLFAPSKICYLPSENGKQHQPYGYPESFVNSVTIENFDGLSQWTKSGKGFCLKIHREENVLGYLIVDDITFPKFRERYLNAAHTLVEIFSLAIENARAYQTILDAKEELKVANHVKSEFLTNMSHEIRTPLNIIMGFSNILRTKIQEEKFHEMLEYTFKAANSLNTLLNGVLELSTIEAGKSQLQTKPTEVISILNEFTELFRIDVAEKNLELILDTQEDFPPVLLLDEVRFRQVLFNIIGNAVKFTEIGSVNVSLKYQRKAEKEVDMLISIADTGIGIPEDQQDKIFENFHQVDGSTTRMYQGTGLGLALSKKLVEMMNGELWVDSEVGKGSVFTILLKEIEVL
ncbi:MAG: DUF1638 domain-containing protein [Leptospiraceae bacterium]|nr:DUF1638 domain-containing protein [Leptospiraceae bacterium]MCP5495479.1 DUF1638 domain-containing protein [Leptospiraceae bacterium]